MDDVLFRAVISITVATMMIAYVYVMTRRQ
jgi:hypothetical protein